MLDKKALKTQYKNALQPMGVYRVTNAANGKVLIGSSTRVSTIWNSILFQLQADAFTVRDLQQDFRMHGEGKFAFDIVDYLEPKKDAEPGHDYSDELKTLEQLWLDNLQPYGDKGYNVRKQG